MPTNAVEIKGEMILLSVIMLSSPDLNKVTKLLRQKRDTSPQLFTTSPVLIDCSELGINCNQLDMVALRDAIIDLGFIPVGIRNIPEECHTMAARAGWAILRPARHQTRHNRPTFREADNNKPSIEVVDRPVRSGQQVYFPDGDVVVLQHTSAGSEILAGGSVHVYGSLRGRVLAGIHGDTSARIFCQKLEAELVAIAGNYRLLDEMDTELKSQPAMVWLDGEKLKIAPMF